MLAVSFTTSSIRSGGTSSFSSPRKLAAISRARDTGRVRPIRKFLGPTTGTQARKPGPWKRLAASSRPSGKIKNMVSKTSKVAAFKFSSMGHPRLPENRLQLFFNIFRPEGLPNVSLDAVLQERRQDFLTALGGDEDHGNGLPQAILPQSLHQGGPVHFRHVQVRKNQVDPVFLEYFRGLEAIGPFEALPQVKARDFQDLAHQGPHGGGIIHYENIVGHHHSPLDQR